MGPACSQAIKNFSNGMPPDKCGLADINGEDDEALVRVLPVALLMSSQPTEDMLEQVTKLTRLTHSTVVNDVCCSVLALIIRNLLLNRPEKVFEILEKYYSQLEHHADVLQKMVESKEISNKAGHAVQSFWTAWRVFSNNQDNFRQCVARTIRLGGPVNVTAGLAGMLCGLKNGLNEIPMSWLTTLKLTPEATEVIDTFMGFVLAKLPDS